MSISGKAYFVECCGCGALVECCDTLTVNFLAKWTLFVVVVDDDDDGDVDSGDVDEDETKPRLRSCDIAEVAGMAV